MKELPKKTYIVQFDENGKDGWAFGLPRGIKEMQWPRSPINGIPMKFLFTIRIPEQYNHSSGEYLSLFQADDHVSSTLDVLEDILDGEEEPPEDDPFLQAIKKYGQNRYKGEIITEDEIGGAWAILYQKKEEIAGEPCPFPEKTCPTKDDDLQSYIDFSKPESEPKLLTLRENTEDINTGKAPEEFPDWLDDLESEGETFDNPEKIEIKGYVPMFHELGEKLNLDKYFYDHHFGGTAHPVQGYPDLSPWYFEFDEGLGNPNLGGDGVAQIDLSTNQIYWACG